MFPALRHGLMSRPPTSPAGLVLNARDTAVLLRACRLFGGAEGTRRSLSYPIRDYSLTIATRMGCCCGPSPRCGDKGEGHDHAGYRQHQPCGHGGPRSQRHGGALRTSGIPAHAFAAFRCGSAKCAAVASGNRCVMFATNYLEISPAKTRAPAPRTRIFSASQRLHHLLHSGRCRRLDRRLMVERQDLRRHPRSATSIRRTAPQVESAVRAGGLAGRLYSGRAAPDAVIYLPAAHRACQRLRPVERRFCRHRRPRHFVEKHIMSAWRQWDGDDCAVFGFELGALFIAPAADGRMLPGTLFPPVLGIARFLITLNWRRSASV